MPSVPCNARFASVAAATTCDPVVGWCVEPALPALSELVQAEITIPTATTTNSLRVHRGDPVADDIPAL
jgi:hypothetical protein